MMEGFGLATDSISFSGSMTISTPHALPKSMEVVSQKFACVVECDIQVLDRIPNSVVCETKGSFDDIGRTSRGARKYALGKVIKSLFNCIKDQKKQDLQFHDMDTIFKTLEQEEVILKL